LSSGYRTPEIYDGLRISGTYVPGNGAGDTYVLYQRPVAGSGSLRESRRAALRPRCTGFYAAARDGQSGGDRAGQGLDIQERRSRSGVRAVTRRVYGVAIGGGRYSVRRRIHGGGRAGAGTSSAEISA